MGSARSNDSRTARTVQGPRAHSTRRISSSALVGRGGRGRESDRFAIAAQLIRCLYTKLFVDKPVYAGRASRVSRGRANGSGAASGKTRARAWWAGDSRRRGGAEDRERTR